MKREKRSALGLRSLCTFIVLCSLILFSGCSRRSDWVQFRGEGGRGLSRTRISPPLGVRWKIKLQFDDRTLRSLNPPVVLGDTIYFGSADGNFYALDVESGYMRWVFRSGAEINSIPYADKDHVYFGSKDGRLYALSRETGEEVWNFRVRSQINSQVERYKDYIVFVGDAEAIHFLSPDGVQQFFINNPGWYNFTFLMHDDVMYFATGPTVSQIGPYDINNREFLWFLPFHRIAATWYSFPAVKGDLLYFGTADEQSQLLGYYAHNRHTGDLVWEQRFDGIWEWDWNYFDILRLFRRNYELLDFMAPTVWKNLVIFAGGDMAARAFDANTGALKWQHIFDTPISSAPTIAGNRIYFGLLGNEFVSPSLVCVSARDGKVLWSMDTEGALLSAPVIAGKRIIFGTDKSVFYVLEEVF
jgi:outer membrane protein assembly factor BamB